MLYLTLNLLGNEHYLAPKPRPKMQTFINLKIMQEN